MSQIPAIPAGDVQMPDMSDMNQLAGSALSNELNQLAPAMNFGEIMLNTYYPEKSQAQAVATDSSSGGGGGGGLGVGAIAGVAVGAALVVGLVAFAVARSRGSRTSPQGVVHVQSKDKHGGTIQ